MTRSFDERYKKEINDLISLVISDKNMKEKITDFKDEDCQLKREIMNISWLSTKQKPVDTFATNAIT